MWRRFGLSCLLLMSSLAVASQELSCFADTVKRQGEASASLTFKFRGGCGTGMVVIETDLPQHGSQVLVQSFQLPVVAVWFEDLNGDREPDLMLQTSADQSAGKLMVFLNLQGRFVHQWLNPPDSAQQQGYLGRDKLYIRWGKLVRLLRYQTETGEAWRRLVYNFDAAAWQREH